MGSLFIIISFFASVTYSADSSLWAPPAASPFKVTTPSLASALFRWRSLCDPPAARFLLRAAPCVQVQVLDGAFADGISHLYEFTTGVECILWGVTLPWIMGQGRLEHYYSITASRPSGGSAVFLPTNSRACWKLQNVSANSGRSEGRS